MHSEIRCEWALVTGPDTEPIDLEDAKQHASIHQDDENSLIQSYVAAARSAAEIHLQRALMTQTWQIQVECFADVIWLPMASPLQNDSQADPSTAPVVQYYDTSGVLQTLATSYYLVDTLSEPGRILRAPNQSWPSVQSDRQMPVLITYVCGHIESEDVSEIVKQGIRLAVAGFDGDRIGESNLLAAQRCWDLAGRTSWRPPTC